MFYLAYHMKYGFEQQLFERSFSIVLGFNDFLFVIII